MRSIFPLRCIAAPVALGLIFVVAHPRVASAKQDWLGWLEEFSGPGPYHGKEFSAEVLCFTLTERRVVPVAQVRKAFPALVESAKRLQQGVAAFEAESLRLLSVEDRAKLAPSVDAFRLELNNPKSTPTSLEAAFLSASEMVSKDLMGNQFEQVRAAYSQRQQIILQAATAVSLGGGVPGLKVRTARGGRKYRFTCRESQATLEAEREADRSNFGVLSKVGFESPGVLNEEDSRTDEKSQPAVVVSRRDWQTGIVVSTGRYYSRQNALLDPDNSSDDEAQVRFIPLELLAHHKLSPAIDVGAGVGLALFRSLNPESQQHAGGTAFYVVPLSVVVRPFRLFTDKRWGNTVGYRVAVRHFGDLDATNFGIQKVDSVAANTYKARGEFVWGVSAFFDFANIYAAIIKRGKD